MSTSPDNVDTSSAGSQRTGQAPPRSSGDAGAELRAALEARRELGPEYESALVEGFIDRIDQVIDARIEERTKNRAPAKRQGMDGAQLALAIVSIGVGIPLTAITLAAAHSMVATIIVWAAIVIVNIAASRR
ncbi:MAG: hypothetical protein ACRDMV_19345 [Streptosporangiales bacterium]